jgi:hypothetical protein
LTCGRRRKALAAAHPRGGSVYRYPRSTEAGGPVAGFRLRELLGRPLAIVRRELGRFSAKEIDAGPSELLASSTVKDLTVGSGLVFQHASEHELKGVRDRWRLYHAVATTGTSAP